MDVREAVDDDADAVARLAGLPAAAARELLRERSVRLALRAGEVVGVVAFDARPGVVEVTRLAGDADARARLLEEPVSFAEREGMAVEALVPDGERETAESLEAAGFEEEGPGPRFDGERTRRYRLT